MLRDPEELEPAAHPVLLDLEHGFYTRCEAHPSREGLAAPRTRIGRMDFSRTRTFPIRTRSTNGEREFRAWARARLESRMPVYAERDVGSLVGMYTLTPDARR